MNKYCIVIIVCLLVTCGILTSICFKQAYEINDFYKKIQILEYKLKVSKIKNAPDFTILDGVREDCWLSTTNTPFLKKSKKYETK